MIRKQSLVAVISHVLFIQLSKLEGPFVLSRLRQHRCVIAVRAIFISLILKAVSPVVPIGVAGVSHRIVHALSTRRRIPRKVLVERIRIGDGRVIGGATAVKVRLLLKT